MFKVIAGGLLSGMDKETLSILESWGQWQRAANLSEKTIEARRNVITHLLDTMECGPLKVTPGAIIAFTTRPGICKNTVATYHATIRAYHVWLLRTSRRHDDPTLDTPTPKRPRGRPRPVADAKLVMMLATVNRRRTRMMILLAALAGLRVHEIAKIRGDDVDLEAGVIYVTGKGDVSASIPLHAAIAALAASFPREGYWFPSYSCDGPIGPRSVSRSIHKVMVRAGVTGKPHHLRHWYGTSLVRNGADLRTVQELMRHASLATTQIYTDVSDQQRRTAIDTLHLIT